MKRKNLLITTIGKLDCAPSWLTKDRNFDVALIYYPDIIEKAVKNKLEELSDYLFFESGFKYAVLKKVLMEHTELRDYSFFWMPDDDVEIVNGTTNMLFNYAEEYQLELCQPSTTKKNISWKIVRQNRFCELRYTNYVEVMCPLFSKNALELALDSFSYTSSGWGLDFYWSKIINRSIAIIDRIKVYHTKKIQLDGGTLYQKLLAETGKEPHQELDEMIEKYNLIPVPKEVGRIYKKGSFLFYLYKIIFNKILIEKRER
ncbi:MAG: hypothetical protein L3J29_05760 [Cyclobacteriaceae bacterium]|nr:hypothetical protein [Cyclobacteriaceae bacterium]